MPTAMWWGIVTMATVGYGDVTPVTPQARGEKRGPKRGEKRGRKRGKMKVENATMATGYGDVTPVTLQVRRTEEEGGSSGRKKVESGDCFGDHDRRSWRREH